MAGRIVCFGELLLRLTPPGYERVLQSPHLDVFFGGAEANVAITLAAFGRSTAMVSVVPENPIGAFMAASLRTHNVDATHVVRAPGRAGLYFHSRGALHRPAEVIYDREHSSFALAEPKQFDWSAILSNASWLHVSGITAAVSERGAESALKAVQTAKRLGVRVSFDCNFRERVWGARVTQAPRILKELSAHADFLCADDRDLMMMLDKPVTGVDAFVHFPQLQWLARTRRDVASTDRQIYAGELFTRDSIAQSRSYDLHGIVERIGAGDAFVAGLLHRFLDGANSQSAIDFATAAACYKHSLQGDACVATVEEIEALLSEKMRDIKR